MPYDADAKALLLARTYLQGGDGGRAALIEALQLMGWSVRNHQGAVLTAPPPGANTGLALRDYEVEELLWKPADQPTVRIISFAQALAVPFDDADPEELAQDIITTLRKSAGSTQAQQRFWARFIIALGRVSAAGLGELHHGKFRPVLPAALWLFDTSCCSCPHSTARPLLRPVSASRRTA